MYRGIFLNTNSKHQTKVEFFTDEQHHVNLAKNFQITILVHCSTLFNRLEVNNVLVITKNKKKSISFVVVFPTLFKPFTPLKGTRLFIASASLVFVNICKVLLALLPNFEQNSMLMRRSNNLSLFAGTKTHACASMPLLLPYLQDATTGISKHVAA